MTFAKLVMLASGQKDHVVAVELGVSPSSLSRTLSGIDKGKTLQALAVKFSIPATLLARRITIPDVVQLAKLIKDKP